MLLEKARKTIVRHHLLDKGERVVVGVSGGIDSMVLLHLLKAFGREFELSLIVAHVNHGLRQDESEREAELVEKESTRFGLPFEYGRFDVREFSRHAGVSVQDAARRVRYRFLRTVLRKHQAQKIALGHHADDQVETILLRLLRGSGLRGLRGMLPIRKEGVIRPLLESWRGEIESFAAENRIPYLIDSSNLKKDYLRNRIRLDLIPLLEREYQSNFRESVTRTAVALREEHDYVEGEAEKVYHQMVREEDGSLTFRFREFQSCPPPIQWRIVEKLLERLYGEESPEALEEEAWTSIPILYEKLRHAAPSFLLELPRGAQIAKQYDQVVVKRCKTRTVPPFEVELSLPGHTRIGETGKEVQIDVESEGEKVYYTLESGNVRPPPNVVFLDYERLQFPLKMRNFRPGDRFAPLGATGEQKLKKFFIDHKVPRYERPEIPLLISGERIAWVVGHRIDERFKVTKKTKKVLKIEVV